MRRPRLWLPALALLVGWVTTSPLMAQRPGTTRPVLPDTKPYAALAQRGYTTASPTARAVAPRPPAAAPAAVVTAVRTEPQPVGVTVAVRQSAAPPVLVDIRGPDGKVQTFRLEGGREVVKTRYYPLYPGEKVSITLAPRPRR